jgi:hypothetical protein
MARPAYAASLAKQYKTARKKAAAAAVVRPAKAAAEKPAGRPPKPAEDLSTYVTIPSFDG